MMRWRCFCTHSGRVTSPGSQTPSHPRGSQVRVSHILYKSILCQESTVARQLENMDTEGKVANDYGLIIYLYERDLCRLCKDRATMEMS